SLSLPWRRISARTRPSRSGDERSSSASHRRGELFATRVHDGTRRNAGDARAGRKEKPPGPSSRRRTDRAALVRITSGSGHCEQLGWETSQAVESSVGSGPHSGKGGGGAGDRPTKR